MAVKETRIKRRSKGFLVKGFLCLFVLMLSVFACFAPWLFEIKDIYRIPVLCIGIISAIYFTFFFVYSSYRAIKPLDALILTEDGLYDYVTDENNGIFIDWRNVSCVKLFGTHEDPLLGIELYDTKKLTSELKKQISAIIDENIKNGYPPIVIEQSMLSIELKNMLPLFNNYLKPSSAEAESHASEGSFISPKEEKPAESPLSAAASVQKPTGEKSEKSMPGPVFPAYDENIEPIASSLEDLMAGSGDFASKISPINEIDEMDFNIDISTDTVKSTAEENIIPTADQGESIPENGDLFDLFADAAAGPSVSDIIIPQTKNPMEAVTEETLNDIFSDTSSRKSSQKKKSNRNDFDIYTDLTASEFTDEASSGSVVPKPVPDPVPEPELIPNEEAMATKEILPTQAESDSTIDDKKKKELEALDDILDLLS